MKRRKFLIGIGVTSGGGSILLGSGAFSRVESDRYVMIEVAEDPDAYLGLDACDSPNGEEYVDIGDDGHLYVDIGENAAGGEGINSNSWTWFDDLVQICNQGTDDACVWIERGDNWPTVSEGPDEGEPRVDFYLDEDEASILGKDNAAEIGIGECHCIGVRTNTHGIDATAEETLFTEVDDIVTLVADIECPDEEPAPEPAFFEVSDLEPTGVTVEPGEMFDVSATIANTGDEGGTQDIDLLIDDDAVASQELTLSSSENETILFENVATNGLDPGEYTYTVTSEDDEQTASLVITDSALVGYWNFEPDAISDGTVSDQSGHGNDGTIEGDPAVVDGPVDEALDLDGSDDWVRVPHDETLAVQTDDFTLAGWIYTRRTTGNAEALVSKKTDAGVGDAELAYQLCLNGYDAPDNAPVFVYSYGEGRSLTQSILDTQLDPESHYHLAVSYDYDEASVDWFIDGVHVGSDSLEGTPIENDHELFLGVHFNNDGNPSQAVNGILDEIRIYSERKDEPFIQQLYDQASGRFQMSGLEPGEATITQGESITVGATITNTGGREATQEIEFRVNGESLATESVTLASGEDGTLSFDIDTVELDPDEYTYGVYSNDDEQTASLIVEEPDPVYFTVTDLEPGETTITQGDPIDVSATITNTGSQEGTQEIELRVNEDPIGTESVTIGPDENTTASFDNIDTADFDPGYYTYGIHSENDERTASLVVTDSALVGYWNFESDTIGDGTVSDRSGQGNDGTIEGNPAVVDGPVDEALDLDGSDDWVRVPHDETLAVQTDDFTLAGWIHTRRASGNAEALLSKKTDGSAGDGELAYQLCLNGYGVPDNAPVFVYSNGSDLVQSSVDAYFAPESYYHLAVSYDHDEASVDWFIDGVHVGSDSLEGTPIENDHELFLGVHFDNGGNPSQAVDGILDEIRIYNEQKDEGFVRRLVEPGIPESTYRPQFGELLNDQFAGGGFTDPLPEYDPDRDSPYLLSVNNNSDNTTDLYESDDLSSWDLVETDITPEFVDDGGSNLQDYVKIDGTYYVYASKDDETTELFSGPDWQSLTNEGTVIEEYADCGVFYENGTYYLYTEGEPHEGQPTSNELLVHTSENPDGPFELQGVAVDVSDRVWHTGDPCIIDVGDHYDMFMDRSIDHPTYTTALARSTDLLNWTVVDDGITHWTGGDMQVLDVGDSLIGFTEFTGQNRGQNGVGIWEIIEA